MKQKGGMNKFNFTNNLHNGGCGHNVEKYWQF